MGDDLTCVGPEPPAGGDPTSLFEGLGAPLARPVGLRRVELFPLLPHLPAGTIRGGNFGIDTRGGVFAIYQGGHVSSVSRSIGFRCAR